MSGKKTEEEYKGNNTWTRTTTYENTDGSKDIYRQDYEHSMLLGSTPKSSGSHEHVDRKR